MQMDIREHGRHIDFLDLEFVPHRGDIISTGYKTPVYLVQRVNFWNDSSKKTNITLHVEEFKTELEAKNEITDFY